MNIGDRFGRLTVVGFDGTRAVCQCDCGNLKKIRKTSLTHSTEPTRSCGCIQVEVARRIGSKTIAQNSKKQIERNVAYRTNLQVITQSSPNRLNTSGVKGVSWCKSRNVWESYINVHSKRIHLGRFSRFEDAVKARRDAEEKYHKPLIERANLDQK